MPAKHDFEPGAMTETERLDKRRYQAYFAFEMSPEPLIRDSNLNLMQFEGASHESHRD